MRQFTGFLACLTLLSCLLKPLSAQAVVPELSPKKIVLLHMHNEAHFFKNLGELTLSNKERYAARHGYEMAVHIPKRTSGLLKEANDASACGDNQPGSLRDGKCYVPANERYANDKRAATFGKIKLARAACTGRDGYWMLWMDADALIVNQSIPLVDIIDDRYDIMVSVDWLMFNAGVMLFRCSEWTRAFLTRVYEAKEFDLARALDQSAFQHFFDKDPTVMEHVKYVPKWLINVYIEEYIPGDFLLHMAGKLYEATEKGALALANQFDALSMIDDVEDVASFFESQYLLGKYSGICVQEGNKRDADCPPADERRLRLKEPLRSMSQPNRYRHVGLRYHWLHDWSDKYDVDGWDEGRVVFEPARVVAVHDTTDSAGPDGAVNDTVDDAGSGRCSAGVDAECDAAHHEEL